MPRGILKRLEKTENSGHIRTSDVEGVFVDPPTPGQPFSIIGESLTPENNARIVSTSPVRIVEMYDNSYSFSTLNSRYTLDVISEEK